MVCLVILVSRFRLSVSRLLGLTLDVWDWKTEHLALDVLQKSPFAEVGFLMIPGSISYDFKCPWDQFS